MSGLPDPTQTPAGRAFLARLRAARGGTAPTPLSLSRSEPSSGGAPAFRAIVAAVGGQVVDCASFEAAYGHIREIQGVVVVGPGLPGFVPLPETTRWRHSAAPVADVLVMRGSLASAEDGAIWVDDLDGLGAGRVRAWPFLVEHLVLVVDEDDVVGNLSMGMDEAAKRAASGFSVWISGPSKTADIEQTLVLGAHGPKRLTVLLVKGSGERSTLDRESK